MPPLRDGAIEGALERRLNILTETGTKHGYFLANT